MIIAAGRGKLRQISLQGHQGPLAHLYFHSHTPSLCSKHTHTQAHRHTRNHTRNGGERRNVSREEKPCWGFLMSLPAPFDYLSLMKTKMTVCSLRKALKTLWVASSLPFKTFATAFTWTVLCIQRYYKELSAAAIQITSLLLPRDPDLCLYCNTIGHNLSSFEKNKVKYVTP